MCGESWYTTKDLQPPFPVLKAGHANRLFVLSTFLNCLGCEIVKYFSKPQRG